MMRQVITLFRPAETKNKKQIKQHQHQHLQFSKSMTIKGKKNSKVKIVSNKKRHNYWGNIFRRKRIMSEYFSDSAFGSQSDTKIHFINPWEDSELLKKYSSTKYRHFEYEYDEQEDDNIRNYYHDIKK